MSVALAHFVLEEGARPYVKREGLYMDDGNPLREIRLEGSRRDVGLYDGCRLDSRQEERERQ